MRAVKRAAPRGLSTRTGSPSAMPRRSASSAASITVGVPCRRRSRSDWLKEEFRKNRFGGTMHCSGKRVTRSARAGPSVSGVHVGSAGRPCAASGAETNSTLPDGVGAPCANGRYGRGSANRTDFSRFS